jgi:hypothetical protein
MAIESVDLQKKEVQNINNTIEVALNCVCQYGYGQIFLSVQFQITSKDHDKPLADALILKYRLMVAVWNAAGCEILRLVRGGQ